jgi:hypothetical protein
MMEKLAQAGESGGWGTARPPSFTTVTITYKVAVYAPAEWADTLTLFHLYHMYSVSGKARASRYKHRPSTSLLELWAGKEVVLGQLSTVFDFCAHKGESTELET